MSDTTSWRGGGEAGSGVRIPKYLQGEIDELSRRINAARAGRPGKSPTIPVAGVLAIGGDTGTFGELLDGPRFTTWPPCEGRDFERVSAVKARDRRVEHPLNSHVESAHKKTRAVIHDARLDGLVV